MAQVTTQTESRTIDRTLAFTRDAIMPQVKQQAFNHSPVAAIFLTQMLGDFGSQRMSGSGKTTQTGGESCLVRVGLGKGNAKRMAGAWDTHGTAPSDVVRGARANWMHYSSNATISDTDLLINTGPEAISSLVAFEVQNAITTLADLIADDVYDNGGVSTAITSLDDGISAASSTLQGLASNTYSDWKSRGLTARGTADASVTFTGGSFATQGIADMLTAYNNASEGMIQPNVILNDYLTFERYEGSLTPQQQFVRRDVGDGSFDNLAFKGRPMFPDDKAPSNTQWFLRVGDDGVQMKFLAGAEFTPQGFKKANDQEASVEEYQAKCQLVFCSRKYNNKITGISD